MKLRNKKTGEIVKVEFLNDYQTDDGTEIGFRVCESLNVCSYTSLAELNAEWEDYEKPKEYWYIDLDGEIQSDGDVYENDTIKGMKQIGNYFSSREEAEKAVEKLKAWKRLKDARFEFGTIKYNIDEESSNTIAYDGIITIKGIAYEDFVADLDLLFGGEE